MHISELRVERNLIGGTECYILLPGSSGGLNHPLMKLLFAGLKSRKISTVMLEYPYQTKNAAPPANDLSEEIDSLKVLLADLEREGYERFNYITKSIGGLVATWLMREDRYKQTCTAIHIMGFVVGRGDESGVDLDAAGEQIGVVVQGELDDYGDSDAIRKILADAGCNATVIGIPDGDHSYRHLGKKDVPTHEKQAVDALFATLGI